MANNEWVPAVVLAAVIGVPSAIGGYALKGCVSDMDKADYKRASESQMILPYNLQVYDHKGNPTVGRRDKKGPNCVYWKDGDNSGADCYQGDHMVKIHGHGSQEFQRKYDHSSGRKHWTKVRQRKW